MEKRSSTHDINEIKKSFKTTKKLRMTSTARKNLTELGLRLEDVINVIQSIKFLDFHKSMTTYTNHKVWQDVYYPKYNNINLYVKFMVDSEGYLIVSFKEKEK